MRYIIKTLLFIFLSSASYLSYAQNSKHNDNQDMQNIQEMRVSADSIKPMNPSNNKITKKRLRILTIGIGNFDDKNYFEYLASYSNLSKYKKIAERHLKSDYRECIVDKGLSGYVGKGDVVAKLKDFTNSVHSSDIILIPILSHGAVDENKYYLICSDTKYEDYQHTALPCEELLYYFKKMADTGAVVVVFLETCNSGAIVNDFDYTPKNNGMLTIYSSSRAIETSKQIQLNTYFTSSIQNTLKSENKDAFPNGYLTLGSLYNQVWSSVKNQPKDWEQKPEFFSYPDIRDYPIISKKMMKNPSYVYAGAAVGTNITPTPYTNVNIGVDINQRHKIEVGASLAFTQSDDVFFYDKNGILQNGYNYRGWNIYGRYGYNFMPEDSKLEIVPLIGVTGNFISGKQLSGYNSNIGKSASSFMGSVNCRFAYSLYKDKKFLLHGTFGCDLPIKKDGNVDILKEDKYIKNWCSIRPHIEIGIIAKLFHF